MLVFMHIITLFVIYQTIFHFFFTLETSMYHQRSWDNFMVIKILEDFVNTIEYWQNRLTNIEDDEVHESEDMLNAAMGMRL